MTELSELSDEDLMLRVQGGESAAYRTLFGRHQAPIYGYLRRRVGEPELASEVFQETWLRVHRSRATFKTGQPFRPWLYRIAQNAGRDLMRKAQRQIDTVELVHEPAEYPSSIVDRMSLERAITSLPDTLRDAFLLGAVQGLDHNEVAAALDISPANARARISRARAHLRTILASESEA